MKIMTHQNRVSCIKDLKFIACILSKDLQNPIFVSHMYEETNLQNY